MRQGWDTYFGYTDQIRAHNYFPDLLLKDGERVSLGIISDGRRMDEPVFEIYDLEADRTETNDLAGQKPELQASRAKLNKS